MSTIQDSHEPSPKSDLKSKEHIELELLRKLTAKWADPSITHRETNVTTTSPTPVNAPSPAPAAASLTVITQIPAQTVHTLRHHLLSMSPTFQGTLDHFLLTMAVSHHPMQQPYLSHDYWNMHTPAPTMQAQNLAPLPPPSRTQEPLPPPVQLPPSSHCGPSMRVPQFDPYTGERLYDHHQQRPVHQHQHHQPHYDSLHYSQCGERPTFGHYGQESQRDYQYARHGNYQHNSYNFASGESEMTADAGQTSTKIPIVNNNLNNATRTDSFH